MDNTGKVNINHTYVDDEDNIKSTVSTHFNVVFLILALPCLTEILLIYYEEI